MKLDSPITALKGIGSQTEKRMNRIGVYTVRDILLHYPKDYIRFPAPVTPSEVAAEGIFAVAGRVLSAPVLKRTNRMEIVQAKIGDREKSMDLVWFRAPYIKSKLKPGETYIFYGRAKAKGRFYHMHKQGKSQRTILPYGTAGDLYGRAISGQNEDITAGVCKDGRVKQSDDWKGNPNGV